MPRQDRHYNYGQKIFEVGEMGTLGMVTWGLGGLQTGSYRTFIAQLADDLKTSPAKSVREVAERWASRFWVEYSTSLSNEIKSLTTISGKRQFDPSKPAGDGDHRSLQEEVYFQTARNQLVAGFCLGGYTPEDRTPEAFQIIFDPLLGEPVPETLPPAQSFWGVPALITRLINGCADEVVAAILSSGFWQGTESDLTNLIGRHKLVHPSTVPIREAIDFTHACLLTTVKAMKFSNLPLVCGGPIELAVITTDRPFRWVRHKGWDSAIREGDHGLRATFTN